MSARNPDAEARAARERIELAVVSRDPIAALAACDAIDALFHAGYVLHELPHPSVTEARPVLLCAKYAGRCASCNADVAVGDYCWWQRGATQGIECDPCGRRKGWKAA